MISVELGSLVPSVALMLFAPHPGLIVVPPPDPLTSGMNDKVDPATQDVRAGVAVQVYAVPEPEAGEQVLTPGTAAAALPDQH